MLNDRQARFIARLKPIAEAIDREFGIKPPVILVQSAHESNWGESLLTIKANNLFGMMAGRNWLAAGKPIAEFPTTEFSRLPPEKIRYWDRPGDVIKKQVTPNGLTMLLVNLAFRKYDSWTDSILDWSRMVTTSPRFAKAAIAARVGNVLVFAAEMQLAGYATDPNYAGKLARLSGAIIEGLA